MKKNEKTKITTKTGRIKKTYECKYCNYFTTKKTDYFRHLKRKKHLKNVEKRKKRGRNGNFVFCEFQNRKKSKEFRDNFLCMSKNI